MTILFLGSPAFAVPSLQRLLEGPHRVLGVVTQPDRPQGRFRQIQPSPVKAAASAAGLNILQPERAGPRSESGAGDPSFLDSVRALGADCAVVAAYGWLLPPDFLNLFPLGAINLHASLLPKYRGAAPIAWALIRGESETGLTVFRMDERLDHGPIGLQVRVPILPDETGVTLSEKLSRLGGELLTQALDSIPSGRAVWTPQEDALASYAPRLRKEDGRLEWGMSAADLHRRIRGLQPWPGAYTSWNGKLLRILAGHPDPARCSPGLPAGSVVAADPGRGLWVQTGQGQLRLDLVQLEGGKPMPAGSFLRGHRLAPGTRLD